MDKYLFYQLETAQATKVVEIGNLDYYSVVVNGYRLMFAQDRTSIGPSRMFVLNDEFARCLGFWNYEQMRYRLHGAQFWRGMLTTKAIMRKLM